MDFTAFVQRAVLWSA